MTARPAPAPGHDADVIVVGGGPAGASVAWSLARAGADVLVLDRARFPRDKPCSEYLSPEAARVLDAMGALAPLQTRGAAQLAGMIVRAPGGACLRGDFAGAHAFRGYRDRGIAVRRRVLDDILLDRARAAGARVAESTRVTDVIRSAGVVRGVRTLEVDGAPGERAARMVIGADGLRSVVARRLGVVRAAPWPRRLALVTHYAGVSGLGDCGEMFVERDGYAGIAPVDDGLANVAVVVPVALVRETRGDPAAFLERFFLQRPHLAARLAGARRVSPVLVTGPFASRARRAWAAGAALTGDAADFFDPFTGEGIYAALRGGELLAPAVLASLEATSRRGADGALRAYDAARRREFAGKWLVERLVSGVIAVPALIDHAARVLSRRKDLADLLVGVCGDFVPPRAVLSPGFALPFLTLRRGGAPARR